MLLLYSEILMKKRPPFSWIRELTMTRHHFFWMTICNWSDKSYRVFGWPTRICIIGLGKPRPRQSFAFFLDEQELRPGMPQKHKHSRPRSVKESPKRLVFVGSLLGKLGEFGENIKRAVGGFGTFLTRITLHWKELPASLEWQHPSWASMTRL